MKKYILVLGVMILSACLLSGCLLPYLPTSSRVDSSSSEMIESSSEIPSSSEEVSSEQPSAESSKEESKAPEKEEGVGEIADGDYTIKIKEAVLTTDYQGKSAVVIKYDFTNNSNDTASYLMNTQAKVFQGGVELESAVLNVDDENNTLVNNSLKEIKTGVTLEVGESYLLNDTTTPLEVEVQELITFVDSGKVTKTIPIA